VQSWNEWDPLKRVIVGRPEGTNVPAPEPVWWYDLPEGGYPLGSWGPFPEEMVDAANEQMDYFVDVLESHDVTVDRVEIQPFMFNRPQVSVLDWAGPGGGGRSRRARRCRPATVVAPGAAPPGAG
jgi:glycine amidinotransferase